jgi:hypothetical protein
VEHETLSKLYLELSQVVPAETKTARELSMETAIREAHGLLTWTFQHMIEVDEMPDRGWWHVKDLNPNVVQHMNRGESDLYKALINLPDD